MGDDADPRGEIAVNVVLNDEGAAAAEATLDELRARGLIISRYRRTLGIATGTVEVTAMARLSTVRGVRVVEPDHDVNLPTSRER